MRFPKVLKHLKIKKSKTKKANSHKQKIIQTDDAIVIKDFYKSFGKTISVNTISFNVQKGTIHGFIGPNGSGKTTTIKTLIGAYLPNKGSLTINGFKVGTKNANKIIGYIPERASFPGHLNASEYLKAMGEISGLSPKAAKAKATAILKDLNLEIHAKRKPTSFSSGMQKKILLAQALINDPQILILDEPAANLDPDARKELFDEIVSLRNQGKTILISSHIMSELERIIDHLTFLYFGDIIYSGLVLDFIKTHSGMFVKTSNNQKVINFLKSQQINYSGDPRTEIAILGVENKAAQRLLLQIQNLNVNILSFRINDLQSSYSLAIKERLKT